MFCEKDVLKNFEKYTGKHRGQSLLKFFASSLISILVKTVPKKVDKDVSILSGNNESEIPFKKKKKERNWIIVQHNT